MATSILEEVPLILRDPMDNPEILGTLLPGYLTDLGLEQAIYFIQGALEHQERAADTDENKWFRIHLDDVEVIERQANGKLFGKKLRLHFKDKGYGKDKDKIVDQSIDTGWIEFHGWNKDQMLWDITLANTLKGIAEDNIGKDLFVQKFVEETDDGKVRHAINIHIPFGDNDDSDKGHASKPGRSRSSSKSGYPDYKDRIADAIKDLDKDEELTDDDAVFLEETFGADELQDSAIASAVKEYLDVKKLNTPEDESDDQIIWAVQLLMENI